MAPRLLVCLLALLMLLGGSEYGYSQHVLRLDQPAASIGVLAENTQSTVTDRIPFESTKFNEFVSLELGGSVLAERVLLFKLRLQPWFEQASWKYPEPESGGGNTLNYAGVFQAFNRGKIGFQGGFSNQNSLRDLRYGVERDGRVRQTRLQLYGRFKVLPTTVEYQRRHVVVGLQSADGVSSDFDEIFTDFRVQAANSKTSLLYERRAYEDLVSNRQNLHNRAHALHRFSWGRGSSLHSRLRYFDRSTPLTETQQRLVWGENAQIMHAERVRSKLNFNLFRSWIGEQRSSGWNARLDTNAGISSMLAAGFSGYTARSKFSMGSRSRAGVLPRLTLTLPEFAGVRITAGGGVGYEWRTQETAEGGTVDVRDEQHTVSSFGSFTLGEQFVEHPSIVVTSLEGGVLYERGVDYLVRRIGALTEIQALAGGRLRPGERVLASYTFGQVPSFDGGALVTDFRLDGWLGGLNFYSRYHVIQPRGSEMALAGLYDETDKRFGARFRASTPLANLTLLTEYGRSTGPVYDFERLQVLGYFSRSVTRAISITLDLGYQIGYRYMVDTPLKGWSAGFVLRWEVTRSLSAYGRYGGFRYQENGLSDQSLGADVGVEWRYRRLRAFARFQTVGRVQDLTQESRYLRVGFARFF